MCGFVPFPENVISCDFHICIRFAIDRLGSRISHLYFNWKRSSSYEMVYVRAAGGVHEGHVGHSEGCMNVYERMRPPLIWLSSTKADTQIAASEAAQLGKAPFALRIQYQLFLLQASLHVA